jgi:hypothetical protein
MTLGFVVAPHPTGLWHRIVNSLLEDVEVQDRVVRQTVVSGPSSHHREEELGHQ